MPNEHTLANHTIEIGGTEYTFAPIKGRHALSAVQSMNDQAQRRALEMIPTASVEERVKVFRATCATYGIDDLGMLANDPAFLIELLYQSFLSANPGTTREEFSDIFDVLDLAMLQAYTDKLSGMGGDDTDPPTQTAEPEGNPTAGPQLLPPSANTTT